MTTHPDFQSFVPLVKDVVDLQNILSRSLSNPEKFVKKTTPVESEYWSVENIKDFTLDLSSVDRVYYINSYINTRYVNSSYHKVRMVARIKHNNKNIYFEMVYINIYMEIVTLISRQYQYIYFSEDPFLFMDVICYNRHDECYANMVKSLRLDGIVPNLFYMCQQKLYKSIDDVEIPLFVKKRLNLDRNINQEAISDYRHFYNDIVTHFGTC